MTEIYNICVCGHKEADHAINYCEKCDECYKYRSVGRVSEEYIPYTRNVKAEVQVDFNKGDK